MKTLTLNFPPRCHVGPGTVRQLGEEAAKAGSHALLVTGRAGLKRAGTTDRLLGLLRGSGLEVALFDEVPPEPELEVVDMARRKLTELGCDLVVEAGGGSVMDGGKAAATLARERAPTGEYQRGRKPAAEGLPHIAIPTTSGTGSEATPNSVLTDPRRNLKKSIRADRILPDVAVVDAELTVSCPPEVTAASGMDALVQAVESYLSTNATAITEALSLKAVQLIVPALPRAFQDGHDLQARAAMSEGSFLAGLALGNARLGAVHGLAHPVGLTYGLPHGAVCGILMPEVLQSNSDAARGKYNTLKHILHCDPVRRIRELLEELGLPQSLGRSPSPAEERQILDYALSSGSSAANPVEVDESYVRSILEGACRA